MSQGRPNVVVFMTDQQRGATVLPDHRLKAITPRLDQLRAEGVSFRNAYTVSPHCCPSRASFFTGLYPSEHGVWNNVKVANALSRGPYDDVGFWSTDLKDAGYLLGFAGKWHVSNVSIPADHGWQECRVTAGADADPGTSEQSQRRSARQQEIAKIANGRNDAESRTGADRQPGEIIRPGYPSYRHYGIAEDAFGDGEVVDSAIGFLDTVTDDVPWCLYVGTLGPHDPYQPPQRFLDLYDLDRIQLPPNFDDPMADKPILYRRTRDRFDQLTELEHREALRHYLAFCSYQDELFGRLYDAVADSGQLENTIFVYLSDHGDYTGDHGLWCKGLPAFDGAQHIPAVIGGQGLSTALGGRPGNVAGQESNQLVSLVDLGPTLLELCGVDQESTAAPSDRMSGRSWVGILRGQDEPVRDELIFQSNGNEAYGIQRTVRTDRWKLVVNFFDEDELYDLSADPDELINLLHRPDRPRTVGIDPYARIPAELRDVVEDLYARLWRFALAHDDDLTNGYIMTALGSFGPGIALPDVVSTTGGHR